MRKLFIFLSMILLFSFGFNTSFSDEFKATKNIVGYELYKDRVKNFCNKFKTPKLSDGPIELIYTFNVDYPDLGEKNDEKYIKEAISNYRDFMDSLYACATSISAKRQFSLIKDVLIKQSPNLRISLEKELDKKIKNLEKKVNNLAGKCKINKKNTNTQIKKIVLNQTTYELCKYNYYLEYLSWQIKNNLVLEKNDSIKKIPDVVLSKENLISSEISNSYKASSLTFKAYSDYEDNVGTHILLQLIREDFSEFRDQLHKTLNPINQVVYKISNAMKY